MWNPKVWILDFVDAGDGDGGVHREMRRRTCLNAMYGRMVGQCAEVAQGNAGNHHVALLCIDFATVVLQHLKTVGRRDTYKRGQQPLLLFGKRLSTFRIDMM